jgi:hypothetical protein
MNRLRFFLVALVAGISFLNSCDKSKSYCAFIAPQMVYIGYSDSERDTMVIRRYNQGGGFANKPLDTFLVSKANIQSTVIGKDSVILAPANYTLLRTSFYGSDWIIILPGAHHADTFTNIQPRFTTASEPSTTCQSFVKTMMANGKVIAYDQWLTDTYKYYIKR